jgi:glycosyltransferase involved in cell wall biosynthesis
LQLRKTVLARVAAHHGCDRVVQFGGSRPAQRRLKVGGERGNYWLGRPEPIADEGALNLDGSVALMSARMLERMPRGAFEDSPLCFVTDDLPTRHGRQVHDPNRLEQLEAQMAEAGLEAELSGWARSPRGGDIAVGIARREARPRCPPPSDFRVLAAMIVYNEADIVVPSVGALLAQGVEVHMIDNWSTDGTPEAVASEFGERVSIERFPKDGPAPVYVWGDLLGRVSELSVATGAHWVVLHDADERRSGPWKGADLRSAIYRADLEGYNAVNHTVIDFPPIDNGFQHGEDFEHYFRHFVPTQVSDNLIQIKAWRSGKVDLRSTGGHEALFAGRKVHPLNFLLKHYPIRSQEHGERKVLRERKPRIATEERDRWHTHYDHVDVGHSFLRDPRELYEAGPDFPESWLLERLYGFGADDAIVGAGLKSPVSEVLRRLRLLGPARSLRRSYRVRKLRQGRTAR